MWKKAWSFLIGPPREAPKLLRLNSGSLPGVRSVFKSKKFRASKLSLRKYSKTEPWKELVPPLLTIIIWLPMVMPYSAPNPLVMTRYSRMPSMPSVPPLMDAVLLPP